MEHTEFTGEFATGAISKNGEVVARLVSADRDFFDRTVLAVNAHEALVDLIKSIKAIESLWLPTKADPAHFGEAKALYGMKERIDAALKKAGVEG